MFKQQDYLQHARECARRAGLTHDGDERDQLLHRSRQWMAMAVQQRKRRGSAKRLPHSVSVPNAEQ